MEVGGELVSSLGLAQIHLGENHLKQMALVKKKPKGVANTESAVSVRPLSGPN